MTRTMILVGVLLAVVSSTDAEAAGGRKWDGNRTGRVQVTMSGGRLGAQISSMTEELRRFFGAGGDEGVLVGHVDPDSPAARAGLAVGDVIVEIDGQKLDGPGDLVGALGGKSAGTKVSLVVVRAKQRQTLSATLDDAAGGQAFSGQGFGGQGFGGQPFGGDVDMDFDFGTLPSVPGMRGFGFDRDEISKLQKQLEMLQRRLEKLEKRPR
jgi:membrane-associated protease RseP (regulator of RpoE activity)